MLFYVMLNYHKLCYVILFYVKTMLCYINIIVAVVVKLYLFSVIRRS